MARSVCTAGHLHRRSGAGAAAATAPLQHGRAAIGDRRQLVAWSLQGSPHFAPQVKSFGCVPAAAHSQLPFTPKPPTLPSVLLLTCLLHLLMTLYQKSDPYAGAVQGPHALLVTQNLANLYAMQPCTTPSRGLSHSIHPPLHDVQKLCKSSSFFGLLNQLAPRSYFSRLFKASSTCCNQPSTLCNCPCTNHITSVVQERAD